MRGWGCPPDKQEHGHRAPDVRVPCQGHFHSPEEVSRQQPVTRSQEPRRLELIIGRQHREVSCSPGILEAGPPPPAGSSALLFSLPSGLGSPQSFCTCFGVKGRSSLTIQRRSNRDRKRKEECGVGGWGCSSVSRMMAGHTQSLGLIPSPAYTRQSGTGLHSCNPAIQHRLTMIKGSPG